MIRSEGEGAIAGGPVGASPATYPGLLPRLWRWYLGWPLPKKFAWQLGGAMVMIAVLVAAAVLATVPLVR
jgi:hypothetical protein